MDSDTSSSRAEKPAADLQRDDNTNKYRIDAEKTDHGPAPEDDTQYPSGFKLVVIILSLVLAIFLASLDMTIVATAIPKITDEFKGLSDVSWYGSAFFRAPDAAAPATAPWRERLLQMDLSGVAMVVGALLSYVLALQHAGVGAAWDSGLVVGLLVGFVLILAAFAVWERFQGERAMIVPRLFAQRPVGTACLFTLFFSGSCYLVIYYLPIYFQSVFGVSPTTSGVDNLPLIVAISVAMILSGAFASAAIAMVASGLLYTLDVDTSTGRWVGYQILGSAAWGMAWQLPIIVGQSSASASDISTVTAMVLFFMNFGGTTFVSAAQAAFVNTIINTIPSSAPAVDPVTVIDTGATQIRAMFPADQVSGIVLAYMSGIKVAFAISIGATGLACIISLACRWKRLNTEDTKASGGAA
ncbi:MFS general substrate transporter [Colletotrichum falcatum]|nr:MFS general substrate transporter [Colletotrichum falcatum]